MGTLLYFIVIAGFFFLMMRFGCGAHVMGHGHGQHERRGSGLLQDRYNARWVPPETAMDPVCGMTVRTDVAKSSVYEGRVYYFCSAEHRDTFESAPGRYAGARTNTEAKPMERSHG